MICPYCQKNIPDENLFCLYCGKKIEPVIELNTTSEVCQAENEFEQSQLIPVMQDEIFECQTNVEIPTTTNIETPSHNKTKMIISILLILLITAIGICGLLYYLQQQKIDEIYTQATVDYNSGDYEAALKLYTEIKDDRDVQKSIDNTKLLIKYSNYTGFSDIAHNIRTEKLKEISSIETFLSSHFYGAWNWVDGVNGQDNLKINKFQITMYNTVYNYKVTAIDYIDSFVSLELLEEDGTTEMCLVYDILDLAGESVTVIYEHASMGGLSSYGIGYYSLFSDITAEEFQALAIKTPRYSDEQVYELAKRDFEAQTQRTLIYDGYTDGYKLDPLAYTFPSIDQVYVEYDYTTLTYTIYFDVQVRRIFDVAAVYGFDTNQLFSVVAQYRDTGDSLARIGMYY